MKNIIISAALALGVAAPASAATILTNGSFEDTPSAVSNWTVFAGGIDGWDVVSGAGVEIQTNGTLNSIDAQDGNNYVELDSHNNSAIGQTVDLTAGVYELSFYYSPRVNSRRGVDGVLTNKVDFSFGSWLSGSVTGPEDDIVVGDWTLVTERFSVTTDGSFDLIFSGGGVSDSYGGLIDNAKLSAVPLPAGALLLLTGLGGLAAMRRRNS